MDEKEVKKFVAEAVAEAQKPLKADIELITKERNDFKIRAETAEKKQADFEADQKKEKVTLSRKAVTDLLDNAVRDKSMTPAMREVYSTQIGVGDDNRVVEIDVEQVKLMCGAPKGKDEEGRMKDKNVSDDPSKALTTKTYAFMAEHGEKSFTRALEAVAKANPELHKLYLDSNVEG